jgi:hypothetical protein
MLHPDNRLSRALFSEITGIQLPPQSGKTWDVLTADPIWGQLLRDHEQAITERQEAANRERIERERIEREQAAKLARMDKAKSTLLANGQIDGETLLELARYIGIDVHPRTAGTLKKRIGLIGNGSCRVYGGSVPDGVWVLYREVMAVLQPEPAEESSPEVNRLFGLPA